jgi:fibronectin type 3 domain-containing protein
MKPGSHIRHFLLALLLLSGWGIFSQNLPVLTFQVTGKISLRWPALHETDLEGYHVYRIIQEGNDWQRLTVQPVSMIRSAAQIREQAGYKSELFLQLFGMVNPVRDIDNQAYQDVINDPASLSFLDVMTLINPEFGKLMGVVFIDSLAGSGEQVQYKITSVKSGTEKDYALSPVLLTGTGDKIPGVTGLEGEPGHQSALLSWDKSQEDLRSGKVVTYAVYRSDQLLGEYERMNLFGLLPVKITSGDLVSRESREEYRDNYLENGRTYFYYVRAVNAFGKEGSASAIVEVTPEDNRIPPSPVNLQAEPYGTGLKLSWETRRRDIKGFEVFRSTDRNKGYTRIYPMDDLLFRADSFLIDLEVRTAMHYYYYMTAVGQAGQRSAPSDTLAVFLEDKIPPSAPGPVKAVAEAGRITLSWPKHPETDVIGYHVERASDDAFKSRFLLTGDFLKDTVFTDTLPAQSETTYGYVVYAFDKSYNRSAPSKMVKARLPDQTPPSPPVITKLEREGKLVNIAWTRSAEKDFAAYRLYRAESSPEGLITIGLFVNNQHTDTLKDSGKYFYAVAATDSAGNESRLSMSLSLFYDQYETPEKPADGKAELAGSFIRVEWQAVSRPGTAGYVVTREDMETGKKLDVAQVKNNVTTYIDRFAKIDREYLYYIRTHDDRWRMSEALVLRYNPEK